MSDEQLNKLKKSLLLRNGTYDKLEKEVIKKYKKLLEDELDKINILRSQNKIYLDKLSKYSDIDNVPLGLLEKIEKAGLTVKWDDGIPKLAHKKILLW